MSDKPKRIFIIAGEHSGDLLGAKLMAALQASATVTFAGVGGHAMEEGGLAPIFPLADIAVMGPLAILRRLPALVRRVYQSVDAALAFDPDVVVIIDAPEFTHPVAKRIRKRRPDIPIIDYVSPTIWAWRPGRARKMAPYVDHVLALYPFEPAEHVRLGGPKCTYVGHPVLERLAFIDGLDAAPFRALVNASADAPLLLVLPGSRRSEVERLLGVFGEAVALVARRRPGLVVAIPAMPNVRHLIDAGVSRWPADAPRPVVFAGEDEKLKFAAFKSARAALAASGTVTLELAITNTPMVVAYRVDAVVSALRHLIAAKTSVLPNLITGERAIPEFHQENCSAQNLASALDGVLRDGPARQAELDEIARVPELLAIPGGRTASEAAARVVLDYLELEKN